jgi:membrane fusion protein, heavy metal efflux system
MKFVIVLSLLTGCFQLTQAADLIGMTAAQQKNMLIQTAKIQPATSASGQAYPGEVMVPASQIRVVTSAYPGLVDQLLVNTGQVVKAGQVLGYVSSPDLLKMQREYLQGRAQNRLAAQTLERDTAMFKEGIIAQKRLQVSENSQIEIATQLFERRQLLKLGGMNESAIVNLERNGRYQNRIALVAPISGVLLEQMVAQGQRVEVTTPVLKVAQMNPLWVEVRVPLADIKKNNLQKGAAISLKDIAAKGIVIALLPNMRAQDQSAIVRTQIIQGTSNLFPSQMVDVVLAPAQSADKSLFSIPTSALVNHESRVIVFVAQADGFIARDVTPVSSQAQTSIVSGQFSDSDVVVIAGTAVIKARWISAP